MVCFFLGSFYAGVRDFLFMLELFSKLVKAKKAQLELVGPTEGILSDEQKDMGIKCYGRRTIVECNEYIDSADCLVNIGNRINNQVPSKIFDYISTGKPIINICALRDDPCIKYLDKYPLAITVYEGDLSACDKVEAFLDSLESGISDHEIERIYQECTPKFGFCQVKCV